MISKVLRRVQGLLVSGALVLLMGSAPTSVLKADAVFSAESVFSNTFGTLDANTGVFTPISTLNPSVAGLGVVGGTLYGTDYESVGQLYSIDAGSGVFTPIGTPTGVRYYDFGATNTTLYATDQNTLNLYSIDPTTGAATLIGSTGTPACGASQLSNNSSTLYLLECGSLYTVDTTTGAATPIGPNTGSYDALSFYGGVFYGAGSLPGTIDTIDPTTGVTLSTGPVITGTPNRDGAIFGIAPAVSAVPEPGTVALLGAVLAALPVLRRRKA